MTIWGYISATLAAVLISSLELAYRNHRHPFNDRRFKATAWWLSVALLDTLAAYAVMLGYIILPAAKDPTIRGLSDVALGITIGVLGPLALRSPVKKTEIKGKDVSTGLTYIYDLARWQAVFALDERMVRLRRQDVVRIRVEWQSAGLSPNAIGEEIVKHTEEMPSLSTADKKRISKQVSSVLTLPDESEKMDMLVKILRDERFRSIIDHYRQVARSSPPTENKAEEAGSLNEEPGYAKST